MEFFVDPVVCPRLYFMTVVGKIVVMLACLFTVDRSVGGRGRRWGYLMFVDLLHDANPITFTHSLIHSLLTGRLGIIEFGILITFGSLDTYVLVDSRIMFPKASSIINHRVIYSAP